MNNTINKVLYILGESRKKIVLLTVLFVCLSLLELVGLGMIAPYITLIINPDAMHSNQYFSEFLNLFSLNGQANSTIILVLSVFMVVVFLIKFLGSILINFLIMRFCLNQGADLRSRLVKAYYHFEYQSFIVRNTAEYIYNLQGVVTIFSQSVLQAFLRLISDSLIVFFIISFLLLQNPFQIFLLISLMVLFGLMYDRIFKGRLSRYGKDANLSSARMIKSAQEGFDGYKEIKVLGLEGFFIKSVEDNAKQYARSALKSGLIGTLPRALFEFVLVLFIILLVVTSILFNPVSSTELFSMLGVLGVASIKLIPSLTQVINSISSIRHGENTVNTIYEDLSSSQEFRRESGKNKISECFEMLEVQNVRFSYLNNSQAIKNLSLLVKKGDSVGIIGQSGSGKTTLVDILLGFLEIDEGEIMYNKRNIYSSLDSWRSKVAYIPQSIFLVDDSLQNNITLGVSQDKVDTDRLASAIRKSRLNELVEGLENGVESNIGERGVKLSGGQRQRIALARALYHNKEVIIMDEVTSALDKETEEEIISEIKSLKGEKTMIIIAHHMSTLQHCDQVYKMKGGRICASGYIDKHSEFIHN